MRAAGPARREVEGAAEFLDGDRLSLHCTPARSLTGWPVSAVYFASIPAEHLEVASAALRTLPELRRCSVTAGPHDPILDVWLRTLHDVNALEAHLSGKLGRLRLRIRERPWCCARGPATWPPAAGPGAGL
ncbi:hypothetical protein ACQEVF_40445 [Nonomuraea polychroma]|uniref:hypothetical protein n=1 Tax=Nonomuraea polychroma TaxID=46176 RepID=UPI003D8EB99F